MTLPSAVYSPQLLETVTYEIEQYVNWYRQARVQRQVGATETPEPTQSAETMLVIEAWTEPGKKPTLESLERLVDELKKLKLPVAHVTLAALPNHAQRVTLVDWFRAAAGNNVLISFVADRSLGGGVVVRTPNQVFDDSWRQRLVDGRAKLAGIVRRV